MTGKNSFGQCPFFRRAFSLLFVLFLVLGAAVFMGCEDDPPPEQTGDITPLLGTWEDPTYNDGYKIAETTVIQYSAESEYEGVTYPGTETPGTVQFVRNFNADSGVIIIEYDEAKANGRTFGAVYYRELQTADGTTSAKMSTAGIYESAPPYADITPVITTLGAAMEQFTLDNGDGHYISFWGGPYIKQ